MVRQRVRICPSCKKSISVTLGPCPYCGAATANEKEERWKETFSGRTQRERRDSANDRIMRASLMALVVGGMLAGLGYDGQAERMTDMGSFGLVFVAVGLGVLLFAVALRQRK